MSGLRPNERIHQARVSLFPLLETGGASWTFSTVRYTHGGRVPQIVSEQAGRLLLPANPSEYVCAEALYQVLAEMTGHLA